MRTEETKKNKERGIMQTEDETTVDGEYDEHDETNETDGRN